uniref:Uncharacterized protein n=1 Tax=Romanomermis culicivorax TaxID=13658 RepID=A0A915JBW5_ROMCU
MEMFYSYARAFDPLFLDDVLLGVFARLSGAKFHHLPGNRFNFFCNGILSSHSVGERPPDYLACHGADLPSEQRNLWRQFCSQPIPSDRAIIGILNRVYCSSLV